MNNDKKNIFSESLNNLDDTYVKKISENVPALDKKAKKRILKKCMSRMSETDFESEITVSGTEKYSKPRFRNFALSTAACFLAAIGITGIIFINRNMGTPPDDMSTVPQYTAIPVQSGTANQTSTAVENTVEVEINTTVALNTEKVTAEVSKTPVTSPETENSITPPATEPVTDDTKSGTQKTFLNGLYYISFPDVVGYIGFEFHLDGTLTKYVFNYDGSVMDDMMVTSDYEIIENQFSYGDLDSELHKHVGTIVKPNDGTGFTVQFDDGLYIFSKQAPNFIPHATIMTGTWYAEFAGIAGRTVFEFYSDGAVFKYALDENGVVIDGTLATLYYEIVDDTFTIHGSEANDSRKGTIIGSTNDHSFNVIFDDGEAVFYKAE